MSRASESATKTKKSDEGETETSGTLSSKLFQLKKQIQSARFDSIKKFDEGETETSETLSSKLFHLKKQIHFARFDSTEMSDEGETETLGTLSSKLFHLKKQIQSVRFDSTEKDERETETSETLSSKLFHLKKQIQSARFDSIKKSDEGETQTSGTLSSKLFELKKQIQTTRFESIKSDEGETETSGTLSLKLFHLKKQIQSVRFDSTEKSDEGETETSGTLSSKLLHSTEKSDEGETETSVTLSSKLFHSTEKSEEGETETSGTLSSKLFHSTEKSDEGESETSGTLSSKLFHSTEKSDEGETEISGTLSSKLYHSTEKSDEGETETSGTLSLKLFHLKKQIQSIRFDSIKAKLKWNKKNLEVNTPKLLELARSRNNLCFAELNGSKNMLSLRIECPLCKLSGYAQRSGEQDNVNSQEVLFSLTIMLPHTEKIPPFTTWIFLDKNQRMAEDQSVFGRRQIYYDQYGGETLICSDSEEEIAEPKEEKHKFSEAEDQMLRKVFHEYGVTQEVLTILGQNIKATSSEFQDRFISLMERRPKQIGGSRKILSERNIFLDKSLTAALDSFDNLFCRRCLVFDCRLHGCSQDLIIPSEKQLYSYGLVENGKHCSNQCYLQTRGGVEDASESTDATVLCRIEIAERDQASLSSICGEPCPDNIGKSEERLRDDKRTAKVFSETVVISKSAVGALNIDGSILPIASAENLGKRKVLKDDGNMTLGFSTVRSDNFEGSASKMQKKVSGLDLVYMETEDQPTYTGPLDDKKQKIKHVLNKTVGSASKSYTVPVAISGNEKNNNVRGDEANNTIHAPLIWHSSDSVRQCAERAPKGFEWKSIEKDLYLKGVEIFGKNSCLIARNLLSGLKTCKEVYTYMYEDGMSQKYAVLPNSCLEDSGKADTYYTDQVMPTRSRIFRRRGRARKLKYTGKSTGHPSIPKRIADGKNQSCKQYTPCGCKFMCGKQCPCHQYGTCCEKYCGCSKSCKNRFRGCHCAKSRCRSRQCPCFAAARECDPDVCRNCWVSCGDGSLDEPPAKGNGYQCGNMKLLLKQQQRILLAKSDVAGWGAFLRNPVNKNDYLGEYTGELISHREADKRGKIYDRANSSFLFDLNDQYVVDAYRKGNKLKFTNHSSNPNCYAKVMLVAGDHRVGIFAKEHIEASEELFYDYRYCPDQAPVWAQKPGSSKRDDSSTFHGRAQKHQSN